VSITAEEGTTFVPTDLESLLCEYSPTVVRAVSLAELLSPAARVVPLVEVDQRGVAEPPLWLVDLDDVTVNQWRDLGRNGVPPEVAPSAPIVIGVSSHPLPPEAAPSLELMTCTFAPAGPGRTWVHVGDTLESLHCMARRVSAAPAAATTLARLLPVTDLLPVPEALVVESAHYSMLLSGPEHAAWRRETQAREVGPTDRPVVTTRAGDELLVELNVPQRHNAFSRAMRDALVDGLVLAAADPALWVTLSGRGPSFCSGGDLDEFGTRPDVVAAHGIRLARSAGWAVHRIADRVTAHVHGAVVGAGLEVSAFAGRVLADESAWFCLPELQMGLVPGAGGTVSVSRRIGRWRTAWMVLTGDRVDLPTALEWGLVDGRS